MGSSAKSWLARFGERPVRRNLAIALATTAVIGASAPLWTVTSHAEQSTAPKSRTLGYSFTVMEPEFRESESNEVCPDGFNKSPAALSAAAAKAAPAPAAGAPPERRFNQQVNKNGKPMCLDPEGPVEDFMKPVFITVPGRGKIPGLDLDGQVSRLDGKPAANGCAHDDFTGPNGEAGIDNQLYRATGCIAGMSKLGLTALQTFGSEMRNGSWNVLMDVQNVDDLKNDPDVDIGFYSSQDPAPFAQSVIPVGNRSLSVDPDRRYWAHTKGRIVNGVLLSDPVDVHLLVTPKVNYGAGGGNNVYPPRELYMRGTRVRLKILPDGSLEGALGGYNDVQSFVSNFITYHGDAGSAVGASGTLAYSCPSLVAAVKKNADGYRDPATGQCTAISRAFKIKALPAFVIKGGEGSNVPTVAEVGKADGGKG